MNNKQQRLADKCANIEPLEGRVLILPDKVRTYKSVGYISKAVDPTVSDDAIIEGETEMMLEEVEQDVNYTCQTAVILQAPKTEDRFKVGDTIIYSIGSIEDFDFIKGVSEIRKYDVRHVLRSS